MNQKLRSYKKRMLILCIMLAVVLITSGVSYAIFTSYSSQSDANTLAASCMDLEFNGQNEINLLNTYPISEGEALEQTPYTFTIKNNCDNYIEYYVIASVISTTNKVDSKYVKVSLLGDNDLNGAVINTLESIATPQSLSKYSISENYILKRGDGITKDESRTFNFRMWLDSNNPDIWTSEDVEGKDYQVKISVVGTVRTRPKDDLFVAALIDGEESTSFPTTSGYTASVECTRNGKKVNAKESIVWNGTEWELTAKITNGNVRCNAIFNKIELYTFEQRMASLLDSTANNTDWKVTNENGYRFQGTNPENYFCITDGSGTCEEDKLYRIIGMVDNDIDNNNNKARIVGTASNTVFRDGRHKARLAMHYNIDRVVKCEMAFNKRFRQHDGVFNSLDFSRREMLGGVGDVEVYIGHTTAIIRLLTIVSVPFAKLLPVP